MEKRSMVTDTGLVVTSVILNDENIFMHSSNDEKATVQDMVKTFGGQTNDELKRKLEIYKFIGKDAARCRLITLMLLRDRQKGNAVDTVHDMVKIFEGKSCKELEGSLKNYKSTGKDEDTVRRGLIAQMLLQDRRREAIAILRRKNKRAVSL